MCWCSCAKQVAEDEELCEKWKGTCSMLCWHPWALSVTLRLHLHNSLGFSIVISDLYLHVWEETEVPQGLWQLRASKNQVPAAEQDQISNGCLFLYSSCFLCTSCRSLHRHFQYRCGCSNYCSFFWRNLCLQNTAGCESRWTCCPEGPSVASWSSKIRNRGTSGLARQGFSRNYAWWAGKEQVSSEKGCALLKGQGSGRGRQRGQVDVKTAGTEWW